MVSDIERKRRGRINSQAISKPALSRRPQRRHRQLGDVMVFDSWVSLWSTRATRRCRCRQRRLLPCHWLCHDPGHQISFEKAICASDPNGSYLPSLGHGFQLEAGDPNEHCSLRKPHPVSARTSAKRIHVSDKDTESAFEAEPRSLVAHELINTPLNQFHDTFCLNEVRRTSLGMIACNGLETGRRLPWLCV
jgi:hypothetical protein